MNPFYEVNETQSDKLRDNVEINTGAIMWYVVKARGIRNKRFL